MAELVDALASETSGAIHGSSSLLGHTKSTNYLLNKLWKKSISMIILLLGKY